MKTEVGNRSSLALWAAAQVMAQMGEFNLERLEEMILARGAALSIKDAIQRVRQNAEKLFSAAKKLELEGPKVDKWELLDINDAMLDLAADFKFLSIHRPILDKVGLWGPIEELIRATGWDGRDRVPIHYKVGDIDFDTLGRVMTVESPKWRIYFVEGGRVEVMYRG